MTTAPKGAVPVLDKDGRKFADLDFRAPDHIEVILAGRDIVRISRAHFVDGGQSRELRLIVRADDVFQGKVVTTIDGIDVGTVAQVVRDASGDIEAVIVAAGGEGGALAIPPRFIREVASHIILEPSAEEVEAAQAALLHSPALRQAIERHASGR